MSEKFTLAPRQLNIKSTQSDSGALSSFVTMLNNPELELVGGLSPDIPPELAHQAERPGDAVATAPPPPTVPTRPASRKPVGSCLLLSGRLAAGKDYIAEKADAIVFAFPEPMYAIASYLCGVEVTSTQNKDLPGMRDFLQKIGQWGRGFTDVKDPRYFYSPERAVLTQLIRALGSRGAFKNPEVDWSQFGLDNSLWVKATDKRVTAFLTENPGKRVAIPNARFEHEIKFFRALPEWDHWHIMCSLETWTERLAKKKLTPQSKEVSDVSEQIAIALDRDVYNKIKKQPQGNMLRVIWNDHRPVPSKRIYTLPQFLQEVALAEATPDFKTDLEVGQ